MQFDKLIVVRCHSNMHERKMEFDRVTRLEIEHKKRSRDRCYVVTWTSLSHDFTPQDCFSLKEAHWYGGSTVRNQHWPIDKMQHIHMAPYLSGNLQHRKSSFGSVTERSW